MTDDAASHLQPIDTRFTLGSSITEAQQAFFDHHGFIIFGDVASLTELAAMAAELDRIQADWHAAGRTHVNGVPIYWQEDPDGQPFITRFTFSSMFSPVIRDFVLDPRFEPIRLMVDPEARVGHDEKDGVVVNRYLHGPRNGRPRLGWHTDGLRDLFYGRMPQAMYNVGLHFDRITAADGGLRLIPGSHQQGLWSMMFRKPYFVSHDADASEIVIETHPGDLTVHDGRLWHRVAASEKSGWASLRRSMYVPYQTGPHEPKSDDSPTQGYQRLAQFQRWLLRRR